MPAIAPRTNAASFRQKVVKNPAKGGEFAKIVLGKGHFPNTNETIVLRKRQTPNTSAGVVFGKTDFPNTNLAVVFGKGRIPSTIAAPVIGKMNFPITIAPSVIPFAPVGVTTAMIGVTVLATEVASTVFAAPVARIAIVDDLQLAESLLDG